MQRYSLKAAFVLTVLLLNAVAASFGQTPLVSAGSTWKYLTGGVDPGANWASPTFDDSAWNAGGPGPLGANGEGGIRTTIDIGTGTVYPAIFFRRTFTVADPSIYGNLVGRLMRDDGAVIYLNGTEIVRDRVPEGTGRLAYLGTGAVGGTDETNYFAQPPIATSALVAGVNVLAVEVHQDNGTSSDLTFDFELLGNLRPSVAITNPASGAAFTVPFSFTLAAAASDSDGSIAAVEFYDGASLLGVDLTAPYSLVVNSLPEGTHTLTAKVTDSDGATAQSAPISITVSDPNPPSLLGATANTNKITVVFSKALVQPSATTVGNYTISPSVTVSAAQYGSASNIIELTTAPMTSGTTYTLTVNNVRDRLGNTIAPNSQTSFQIVAYNAQDIGNPATPGVLTPVADGYNYSGGGTNVSGASDQFTFAQSQRVGDFDLQVRLADLTLSDLWAKAGLMARETLNAGSRNAAVVATPSAAGAFFQYRLNNDGGTTNSGSLPVNYPNTYLRLKREGAVFTGYASWDGQVWTRLGSITMSAAPPTMYVGMLLASGSTNVVSAQFRNVQDASGGTFASFAPPIEPPGPSTRRTGLVITEIMYKPAPRSDSNVLDFVEIYNSNPYFEDISGYRLSGDIDYAFPQGTIMQGGSYLVVAKVPAHVQSIYGISGVLGPYVNDLPVSGTVRLRNDQNAILLEVPYSNDPPWPVAADGTGHSLVLARPSYGEGNAQAWSASDRLGGSPGKQDGYTADTLRNVLINEFLANSPEPVVDYIELYNHSTQPVNIGGCTLSDDKNDDKYRITAGITIPARGFISFDQTALGFGLSSGGEAIYFKAPDGRVLDTIKFEAQANGVSSGRVPDGGENIYPLKNRTPAAANGAILVNDIVINEIMYEPINGDDYEYVELFNMGTNSVNLSGWRFTAGISYTFPSNTVLNSSNYLVVAKNSAMLLSNYTGLNIGNTIGDYSGSLANSGERLALAFPDVSYTTNNQGSVSTNTVYVVVDEVTYGIGGHWGDWHKEGGSSLELSDPRSNHRLAYNWGDSDETAKAPWTIISATGAMEQGAATANLIEILTLGEGEYLVDDIEVLNASGVSMLTAANSSVDAGMGGWIGRGTHDKTGWDSERGFGNSGCLVVRATARGDSIANRVVCPITVPNGVVTLRAKVRWLKGWPEILLRLHGNYYEAFSRLQLPSNLGTPGARNSRGANNAGPAISQVKHSPVLPGANENAVVTARIADPDGLGATTLFYRIDPSASYSSVAMQDNGAGGDAVEGDGVYSATIPGQAAGTLVAFYVQAADTRGAITTLPRSASPTSKECLVRFGDPILTTTFGTYRQWLTVNTVNTWSNRPALSNQRVFGTFIYGNIRAIYNHGVKYSSSPYHQGQHSSPVLGSVHYAIEMPLDDQCLGTENWNKVHAPGNSAFDENTNQREQIGYWFARKMGLPWNYRRYVHMYVNGFKKGSTAQIMEDTERGGDDFVDSRFPDDRDGWLYKIQPWFEVDDGQVVGGAQLGFGNNNWCTLNRYSPGTNSAVHFTPRYRNNWLVRGANGTANDFSPVFALVDAAQTATNGWTAHTAALENLADMENWMRTFSVHHSVGDWDHFGSQNAQNMYGYKPRNGKWSLMIWDFNILMGNSGSWGPGQNLFIVNASDSRMPWLYSNPKFRRSYLRGLKEMAGVHMQAPSVEPMIDARQAAFIAGGVNVPAANVTTFKTWIRDARNIILPTVAAEDTNNFVVTVPSTINTSNNLVTITGVAPLEMHSLRINGILYDVVWTSVRNWTLRIAVTDPLNVLNIQGYDVRGRELDGFASTVTVNYSGPPPIAKDTVIFNEIMYNPTVPESSFVELYNRSSVFAFDLSGWKINGLGYTFPDGATLSPGQFLVLAKNPTAFASAYGGGVPIFGVFSGQLDDGGETLTLTRPGQNPNQEIVVDKLKYEDDAPWPSTPDGKGPSLQLLDPQQDNSKVSNWSDGAGWRFYSFTGFPSNGATRLTLFLLTVGNLYMDDVYLTQGTVAETGPNLLQNPSFESDLASWGTFQNHSNTVVSTDFAHTGSKSVKMVSTGVGGNGGYLFQNVIPAAPNTQHTLSFWYLPTTNASLLGLRLSSTFRTDVSGVPAPHINVRPIPATPGAPNTIALQLTPYPDLWLNEVQAVNADGVTDNFGEREPWIELYNSGTNVIDLQGFYLANNFSNLTQWAFPAGSSIDPGEYKVIWADTEVGETTSASLHTSFGLNAPAGSVALSRIAAGQPQIVDYMNYSGQQATRSYGDFPDGQSFDQQVFLQPTPGAPNVARDVDVWINEWMARNTSTKTDPADGDFEDWIELYNPGTSAVDLSGYWLTDNVTNHTQFKIPNGTTIPPHGFLLVWADGETGQNTTNRADIHANFQLSGTGEQIGLYAPNGVTVIDELTFGAQTNDVSQGRFPDGGPGPFPYMSTPTPGAPNVLDGGGENHPPSIPTIGNKYVVQGETLAFNVGATDPDPGQTLTYSLSGQPPGASIGASSGIFQWAPTPSQAPSTNNMTVNVIDSGVPPLSSSQAFTVYVSTPPTVRITRNGADISLAFPTIQGRLYQVQYKNRLTDANWTDLGGPRMATGSSLDVPDTIGAQAQRFYQILLIPQE